MESWERCLQNPVEPVMPEGGPGVSELIETGFESSADVDSSKWYAVRTRSNFEVKVYDQLNAKHIDTFLPQVRVLSKRRDRIKWINVPLFRGYMFVHVDLTPDNHLDVIKTVGVVHILTVAGQPQVVPEDEINNLRILHETDIPVHPENFLNKGDRVMIAEGPFQGLVGFILYRKGNSDRLVVSTEILQRSVAVDVQEWALIKL
jgi:transcription termination/antitermination protein NusG